MRPPLGLRQYLSRGQLDHLRPHQPVVMLLGVTLHAEESASSARKSSPAGAYCPGSAPSAWSRQLSSTAFDTPLIPQVLQRKLQRRLRLLLRRPPSSASPSSVAAPHLAPRVGTDIRIRYVANSFIDVPTPANVSPPFRLFAFPSSPHSLLQKSQALQAATPPHYGYNGYASHPRTTHDCKAPSLRPPARRCTPAFAQTVSHARHHPSRQRPLPPRARLRHRRHRPQGRPLHRLLQVRLRQLQHALHPIPADQTSVDQFYQLYNVDTEELNGILKKYAAHDPARTPNRAEDRRLLRRLHEHRRSSKQKGLKPVEPLLAEIAKVSKPGLMYMAGELQRIGVNAFFSFGEGQDFKDATKQVAQIDQGGLGLPERDYYTPHRRQGQARPPAVRRLHHPDAHPLR